MARETRARRALLDSAVVLLAEHPDASIVEIAEAAGIGRATVYRHFPNRGSLIDALTMEAIAATDAAADAVLAEARSATEALPLLVRALVPLGDRYFFLTRIPEPEDAEIRARLKQQNDGLAQLIGAAQKEGGIDPDMPLQWATAVINSLVYTAWSMRASGEIDAARLEDITVRTLEHGLGTNHRQL